MVEGAPHTAKRSIDQLLCLWGAPLPPYIKEQRVRGAASLGARFHFFLLAGLKYPWGWQLQIQHIT